MKKVFLIACIFLTTGYSFAAASSRLTVHCRTGNRVGMPEATQSAIHGTMGVSRGVQSELQDCHIFVDQ
jgi:ATP-dependent protease ClpP protease subunit